jgi:Family of unknown function (DUF6506)
MVRTKNDMISWAFIFEAPETNPQVDRLVIERGGMRTTIVGVPEPSVVPQVAAQLVAEGVQLIELCGAIEPIWVGRIAEVTGGTIPLGTVGYAGGETIARLADIFSRPVETGRDRA